MNVLEGTGSVWKLPEVGWTCVEHSGRWYLEGWLACCQPYIRRGFPLFEEGTIVPTKHLPITFQSISGLLVQYMCLEVLYM